MTMTTLEDLLVDQVRDLYDAEKQLVRALPKMAQAATSDDLQQAIQSHLEETKNQVSRLEQIFQQLDKPAKAKPCKGMRGLEEGGEALDGDSAEPLTDLAIIAAAQRVEHYEISAYGTARAIATQLGQDSIASLLEETEDEEKAADTKLTEIAIDLLGQSSNMEEMEEEEAGPSKKSTHPMTGRRRVARG
jgi:ferritin-like metal-binding protein YciE